MAWETWDKQKIDLEYSPSRFSKRGDADHVIKLFIKNSTKASEEAKATIPCQLDLPYSDSPDAKLDIFGLETLPLNAPIFVFIHGGYWQMMSRHVSSVAVSPLYKAGIVCVTVGYTLAPNASLEGIVDQVADALCYVMDLAEERKSRGIIIAGHSAGSHLAAMSLYSEKFLRCYHRYHLVKAMLHISGVFDLQPLVQSYVNEPLKLDTQRARHTSPLIRAVDSNFEEKTCEILQVFAVAENDPPEFHRQAQEFSKLLEFRGFRTVLLTVPEADHFSIVEQLNDPDFMLIQWIKKFFQET